MENISERIAHNIHSYILNELMRDIDKRIIQTAPMDGDIEMNLRREIADKIYETIKSPYDKYWT